MANPIGTRSIGAGTTVGPHMTMGYICALDLLKRDPETPVAELPRDQTKKVEFQ